MLQQERQTVEDQTRILSSASDFKRFIGSTLWKDISSELTIWGGYAAVDYDTAESMDEVRKIQGRREAIGYILGLPQMILNRLEEENASRRAAK